MKRGISCFIAALVLFVGTAAAADSVIVVIDGKLVRADKLVSPRIEVVGAEQPIKPGEIVVLEAKVADEYPSYVKQQNFVWTVTENGYVKRTWNQGNQVMFGAGVSPTSIVADLEAKFVYTVGDQDVIITKDAKVNVQIGTPTPTPPNPNPNPTPPNPTPPNPNPTPPDPVPPPPQPTLTGTAKFAYDTTISKGPVDAGKSAKVLAQGFTEVAAQIGHNPDFNDPRTLLVKTKETNNKALTDSGFQPTAWDPWGAAVQDYIYAQYQNGSLKTIEDYKKVWEDLATGLRAISAR